MASTTYWSRPGYEIGEWKDVKMNIQRQPEGYLITLTDKRIVQHILITESEAQRVSQLLCHPAKATPRKNH